MGMKQIFFFFEKKSKLANSKKLSFSKSPILKKLTEIAQQLQKLSKYANTAEAVQIQQLHTLGQLQLHSTAMMNNKHMGLEGRFGSTSKPTSITSKTALPDNLKIVSNHCISSKD